MEALLAFPERSGILAVHVDAIGATVDLLGSQAHELE
jgi:hypothetical protein